MNLLMRITGGLVFALTFPVQTVVSLMTSLCTSVHSVISPTPSCIDTYIDMHTICMSFFDLGWKCVV